MPAQARSSVYFAVTVVDTRMFKSTYHVKNFLCIENEKSSILNDSIKE
jgi:hypothetical protein